MNPITTEVTIDRDIATVWELFNNPEHIIKWNYMSPEWECTYAKNEFKVGGRFVFRITKKDKTASFNLMGTYKSIDIGKTISYVLDDRRKVTVKFEKSEGNKIKVTELFEPERMSPIDTQKIERQAILDNYKKYTETNSVRKYFDETDKKNSPEMWRG